ncbi:hypothetical protein EZ428_02695 [Pedobacter frigiditerrae]|uniref:Uncharacterized protein n=1 Tax=Pedobacter frigiditerrae TaxID=2530452 RepID=A0A4V2MJC5_9SPHI|nr:hypothetical protein [Pedobacter frigiditerrae]TCC93696.1 hypothetical protein EZ428_02695 [Pedobacter frigiditerrae]
MEIKPDQLQSFIKLYEDEFNVLLTAKEAQFKASLLLQYVSFCIKPLAKVEETDINDMPD